MTGSVLWDWMILIFFMVGGGLGLMVGLMIGHYTGRRAERKYVTCNYMHLAKALQGGEYHAQV